MFTKSATDNTVCIQSAEIVIASDASEAVKLPANPNAVKAIIQVFTDSDGITAIGADKLGYTPIASICESTDTATQGTPAENAGKGLLMYNLGIYEITAPKNIAQASIISYAGGYKVYCRIQYYK